MSSRVVKYLWLVLVVMGLAVGCQRIPLYDVYTNVKLILGLKLELDLDLELSVDTDLDADYASKVSGVMPKYVEVLFYDTQNHNLLHSKIMESHGGEFDIPAGDYDIVIYSFGTESTQVTSLDNRTNIEAFTSNISDLMTNRFKQTKVLNDHSNGDSTLLMKGYEDDPIIYEPDHLYVACERGIHIPTYEDRRESITIYATAKTILDVYSLEVLNIKGAENIEVVEAFITGQVKSNYFGIGERAFDVATLYTDMKVDKKNNRLYSVFCTFGKQPGESNKIYLDITVKDTGGGQHRYIYDVTDQFDDPENTNHRLIIDGSEIDIPEGKLGGGGFAPSVDNWDEEEFDVPLG